MADNFNDNCCDNECQWWDNDMDCVFSERNIFLNRFQQYEWECLMLQNLLALVSIGIDFFFL